MASLRVNILRHFLIAQKITEKGHPIQPWPSAPLAFRLKKGIVETREVYARSVGAQTCRNACPFFGSLLAQG